MPIFLTSDQKSIVNSRLKRNLVNAGPGSGKTTTLSFVALKQANRLIHNPPSWIDDEAMVLFVSLTNAAASNARAATTRLIQDKNIIQGIGDGSFHNNILNRITFSTIHSFSFKMLKRYKVISRYIEVVESDGEIENKGNIITFDDMILRFNKLLGKKRIRSEIIRKYPIIIVDEFQDTGGVQWQIIKKLTGPKSYLLCAGDDGQTIFTWSGASFLRFREFQLHFSSAKMYPLTHNFRSTKQIMALSNGLMAQSLYTTKKEMKSDKEGNKPKIICNENLYELYDYIYTQIQKKQNDGITYNDIALIYGFYKDVHLLKEYLSEKGIPFKVYGDKSKRDRPIIKTISSLIKIIEFPFITKNNWEPMLLKIDGIGEKNKEKIIDWLKSKEAKDNIYPKRLRYTNSLKELLEFVNKMKQSDSPNWVKMKHIIDYIYKLPKTNKSLIEHIPPTLIKLAHESKTLSDAINKYNDRSYPFYYPGVFEPPYPDHYLTLSNVHRIKGGEFNIVFYLGTNDDLYEKHGLFKDKKKIENQLQLINVAITRARRESHMLFPINTVTWHKGGDVHNPWRFIRKVDKRIYYLTK
jgi:DNA helicase-2/ATP-dependent DNA helicase PcrA